MTNARLVGHSSSERTLDERDLAALRPARESPRRPRKAPVLREVTSGIVCFCGERFSEAQALEFMLHLRAEAGTVLEWRESFKARGRERQKAYIEKPGAREQKNARQRQHRNDPANIEAVRERNRRHQQTHRARERASTREGSG